MIGDFACAHNKVSEFLYKAKDRAEGFAIKKANFMAIIQHKVGKHMIPKIKRNYMKKLRNFITAHREAQAKRVQTRIDYVDLSAFGVGVEFDDFDHHKAGSKLIQQTIHQYCCKYSRLSMKLNILLRKI